MTRARYFASALMLVSCSLVAANEQEYAQHIKPLLKARCYACHGALKQESELRLDTGKQIRSGGGSGPAVVPGKPDESPLIQRVTAQEPAERMPPEGEPLSDAEVMLLRKWIREGALSPSDEIPEADPDEHWAFKLPQRPELPKLDQPSGNENITANPIDAFVNAELVRNNLTSRPRAAKEILVRRVYLDLIGLPPTRNELHSFLADESINAYEQLVDRLLADPRHGERWGRHWMDIWRYSDWYGRRYINDVRNSASQMFRWRDWIVRSLNEGKPYDRMVQEMLAADEICPEDYEAGVATGYLIRNYYSLNQNDWMRSTVEHTGKAFLGLTFNCAHCHDHKYDPIAHDDYFQLRAFFEPIYIRQDRVPGEPDPGPFQDYVYGGSRAVQRLGAVRIFDKAPDAPTWFYTGGDERNRVKDRGSIAPGFPKFLADPSLQIEPVKLPPRAFYPGLRPEIQSALRDECSAAIATAEQELNGLKATQGVLPRKIEAAEAKVAAARAESNSLEARIAAERTRFESTGDANELARVASRTEREATVKKTDAALIAAEVALAEAEALAASDANRPKAIETATKNLAAAKEAVDKAQAALADEKLAETYSPLSPKFPEESTGRRTALAKWITSSKNPLTARVAVNHIWTRHFHAPLVASMYDFGRNGDRPTHPELLDWLAVELMDSGWDMKHLHRLIVTSDAYCRTSAVGDATQNATLDPENKWLWRMNTGRMEAEVVRDSLLYCASQLDSKMGGIELENKDALTTYRRSLYYSVFPEAGGKSELGELFDAPDPLDCYRRTTSVVPQQALALTNSDLVHRLSVQINKDRGTSHSTSSQATGRSELENFVDEMFEQILSRRVSESERKVCLEFLEQQRLLDPNPTSADAVNRARESLVRILLNHNDFLTIR